MMGMMEMSGVRDEFIEIFINQQVVHIRARNEMNIWRMSTVSTMLEPEWPKPESESST